MAKYTFPAIFEKEQDGGFSIFFPDIQGCYTQSEDMAEGVENASDALCLMLYTLEEDGLHIPKATAAKSITTGEDNIVKLINCDTSFYRDSFMHDRMLRQHG